MKVCLYILFLLVYFILYYINVDEIGAYTFTLVVCFLSFYPFKELFYNSTTSINKKDYLQWIALYIFAFLIVYSKQSERLIQTALDSLIIALFYLSFVKLSKKLKRSK